MTQDAKPYRHREAIEKALLVFGAVFLGTLSALVQIEPASLLRISLAVSCALFLVAFTSLFLLHAMRITELEVSVLPDVLAVVCSASGIFGLAALILGLANDVLATWQTMSEQ